MADSTTVQSQVHGAPHQFQDNTEKCIQPEPSGSLHPIAPPQRHNRAQEPQVLPTRAPQTTRYMVLLRAACTACTSQDGARHEAQGGRGAPGLIQTERALPGD
ncbi:Hypothetical predicted protein [Pelobates cultripes]|uniref:Uncharacterized protein n=1 Tax=Pelobates cultripes TaxID=61616 RepID=A0AAD1SVE3_PELCU|nr:Hypothetical predicted protein [Pelobates cultripes]